MNRRHYLQNYVNILIVLVFIVTANFLSASELDNIPDKALKPLKSSKINVNLDLLSKTNDGTVQLELTVKKELDMKELKFFVTHRDNISLNSPSEWTDTTISDKYETYVIDVKVPKHVNSALDVQVVCDQPANWGGDRIFFDYKTDSLYVYDIFSIPEQIKTKKHSSRPDRDTLTAEQLDVKYEIAMDLRKKEHYDFIKQYVDSLIPQTREGVYHAFVSLKTMYQIVDSYPFDDKIEMEWVDVPWRQNKQQNEKK